MTSNKRITDLTDYVSVLPYASELFGVYQPLIGWRSRRKETRFTGGFALEAVRKTMDLSRFYRGEAEVPFNADAQMEDGRVAVGRPGPPPPRSMSGSRLMDALRSQLAAGDPARDPEWRDIINQDTLTHLLNDEVFTGWREDYQKRWDDGRQRGGFDPAPLQAEVRTRLREESALAGVLVDLADRGLDRLLRSLFFPPYDPTALASAMDGLEAGFHDPFLTFDPKSDVGDVTLSPIGIVHLYRQYFFELDTFLGSPVGHVWMSPGSTVELIEVSTRRTLVEKTIETSLETVEKSEHSSTDEDELSEAMKQDDRQDTKLGFSTTVNQSWGTGNATATGSLNLDTTQNTARENTERHKHQQSEKLSKEIRQNFRSTFRTVTETSDTSSKRYVLSNTTPSLINYELRRKMRQVGVQTQDAGTYLCWETFVDEPGAQLALPNLIHIAQPADLVVVPNPRLTPLPPATLPLTFTGEAVWNFPDNSSQDQNDHPETQRRFVPIATLDLTGVPADYEVALDPANPFVEIQKSVIAAEDDDSWNAVNWGFLGMITPDAKRVMVGVTTTAGTLAWDDRITFKVSGAVMCRLTAAKADEIQKANDAVIAAKEAADEENSRNLKKAYVDSVHDRVTVASRIKARKFEDLREEERTIVYRNLIKALMTEAHYVGLPETRLGHQTRHVLSELLNAIFDIDKMLYFVAPEWWKPRHTAELQLPPATVPVTLDGSSVRWADDAAHGTYLITEEAEPAALGSSLGWLLQLDGDDLRNAFLNAPWVKAVIPIRPGKEQAAINWLSQVGVEGSDGMDAAYAAPEDELDAIRAALLAADADDPVAGHAEVTIGDAVRKLCLDVARKHALSTSVGLYPTEEVNDDSKVLATPLERVFEHGFYPLQGGFKARTEEPFEICSQWIEVLPTDQVVPVEVTYDPRTGRQT